MCNLYCTFQLCSIFKLFYKCTFHRFSVVVKTNNFMPKGCAPIYRRNIHQKERRRIQLGKMGNPKSSLMKRQSDNTTPGGWGLTGGD